MPDDIAAGRVRALPGPLLGSALVRVRFPALVSFLAALVLALNVLCLCPQSAGAAERRAEVSAPAAGHCGGAHDTSSVPAPDDSHCRHCDEAGARLSQSGAPPDLGASTAALLLPVAPAVATLRLPALERALRPYAPHGGRSPALQLRTIVLQV
jgi:hypothetical protein